MGEIRPIRLLTAGVAAMTVAAALILAPPLATSASAAGSVSVANPSGGTTADPDYATTFSVSGRGFQSIQGGFGGIYVLFGWVDPSGSWRPSQGGAVGEDFRYVPDSEAKDNAGFQRFVAFPGSDSADAANAIMDASGAWTVDMVVPRSTFESRGRDNAVSTVDCNAVQCGVITIGGHGVKNANNETFTPISFSAPAAALPAGPSAGAPPGSAPTTGGASAARVGYTASTAIAGNALSFAGRGFSPGEQIVAALDDGVAAVGPLTAGSQGEIAGVLTLPPDLRAGTHVLILTGAASGAVAQTEVAVGGSSAAPLVAATSAAASPAWPYLLLGFAVIIALALLVTSLITALLRSGRSRRVRKSEKVPASAEVSPR